LSSFGDVDIEAVSRLGEAGEDLGFVAFKSEIVLSPGTSTLLATSWLSFTLRSPLSEPPDGV
jgi:hypothetical protein